VRIENRRLVEYQPDQGYFNEAKGRFFVRDVQISCVISFFFAQSLGLVKGGGQHLHAGLHPVENVPIVR